MWIKVDSAFFLHTNNVSWGTRFPTHDAKALGEGECQPQGWNVPKKEIKKFQLRNRCGKNTNKNSKFLAS